MGLPAAASARGIPRAGEKRRPVPPGGGARAGGKAAPSGCRGRSSGARNPASRRGGGEGNGKNEGAAPSKIPGPSASRRLLLLAAVLIPSAALFLAAPASAPPAHADSHQLTAEISNGTDSPTALASVPFVMKFNKGVDYTTLSASDIVASSGTVHNLRVMPQFNAAFSGRGSGTDQIDRPRGVEADGTSGRIYVADTYNHRVQVFHSNGSHATSIVASSPSFSYPYGVEVDGSGSLYVADTWNGRVRIFDSDGSHVADITGFTRPADVAVSGSGHIHVADRDTNTVSIYDSGRNYVTNITGFTRPSGVAVDGTGAIYVANTDNHTVDTFNSARESTGLLPGTFRGPYGVAVDDTSGTIYVADSSNRRVKIFNSTQHYVADLPGTFQFPSDVDVDGATGKIYVADGSVERIWIFDTAYAFDVADPAAGRLTVSLPAGRVQDAGGNANEASNTKVIVIERSPTATITTPAQPGPTNLAAVPFRLKFNEPIRPATLDASDISASSGTVQNLRVSPLHTRTIGAPGSGDGEFGDPRGVAVNGSGFIHVADQDNSRVQIFRPDGTYNGSIAGFTRPTGVAVSDSGAVYVADRDAGNVRKFNPDGSSADTISGLSQPSGVAVDGSGAVYVADRDAGNVRKFNPDGSSADTISGLSQPSGVAVDGSGAVYVADTGSDTVRIYSSALQSAANITGFSEPRGVAVDGSGAIYVADTGSDTVRIYSSALQSAANITGFGEPRGVAVDDSSGTLYVTSDNTVKALDLAYAFDVADPADGRLAVSLPAGLVEDTAGIGNEESNTAEIDVDRTAPMPATTSAQSSPTNARTINFTVAFSEPVTGFELAGIALSGTAAPGNATDFAGSGASYTFGASPSTDGTILVDVPAGGARDEAGNGNAPAERFSITYDETAPVPALAAEAPGPTNLTAVPFNLTFSEPANAIALAASDVVASSGTVQNLTSVWPPNATFGDQGSGPVQFDTPSGIAVDGSGNIYVADRENNRIQVLNSSKGYVAHIPWLDHPTGVTIDGPSGRIYVADFSADVVRIYDHRRTQVALLDDDFAQPSDVAVGGPSGRIHVVDFGNDRVRVYDSSLNRVGEITGFNKPFGVAVDASGIMYVTERDSNRVRIYHPNFTIAGYITGLSSPYGVEVDAFGSIYVADYGSDRVRVYDSSRARVADITGLSGPYGVEVDGAAGALYVTERTAHRIRTFDAPHVEFNVADPADGQVLAVSLPAGLVHDLAGNENAASDAESIRTDRTAPAPNVTSALPGPTAAPTIPFAVDFGENVTGFEASDIVLSGNASSGGVGNFSGSGDSYTFYVSPATNGTILVDVPANVTHDGAGNINTAADQFSITYNSAVSTPTVTATQQSPTNAATINFQVNFSKPVIEFTADGIELSGTATHGGVGNFSGSGDSYTFDVSPTADGTILVDVPAGAARIDAGINSTKSAQFPMTYDGTAPAPTITAAQRGPTNARTINFTVAFSEPVTGFEPGDVALSGAAAPGNATDFSGSGASYAFGASPAADGTILVDVPAGGARDEAGNNNTAAERFSIRYDGTAPVPAFAAEAPGPTNLTAVPFNLTFSEPVNASTLEASDINATSGTVRNLRDAWRHNATFGSGPGSGPGQFDEPSGIAVDASGAVYVADRNNNRVQVLDSAGGHVADITGLAWPNGVAVNASGYLYVADTNAHAVRVYDTNRTKVADITDGFSQPTAVAVGGPSGHAYVVDYGNNRVRVYDSALARVGDITGFSQPRGAAVNASGYLYVADTNAHAVRVYDPNMTKVADIADAADPFGQPYGVAVDASGYSYVADFDNGRVRVYDSSWDHSVDVAGLSGPHAAAVDPASGALYVTERPAHRIKAHDAARDFAFEVADPADGRTLTVGLPAGRVLDVAGNANAASDAESIRIDRTAPAPNVTSALLGPTAAPTIPFTVDFGENVTGFEAVDIDLSNDTAHGGVGNFSGSGSLYTFYVSPATNGTILVDVPANVARDDAGNGNTAAEQFSIIYNTTVPVPTITAAQQSPTNAATIIFQVSFSVPVTEFEAGDIDLSGTATHGGVGNFSGSGDSYTFYVSPATNGTILVDVPAGAARDDAGNRNAPAKQFMITYDGKAPVPTITATQQSPTNAATINFQVKFNENVTGFVAGDIELSNDTAHGGVDDFAGSGDSYSFDVSPTLHVTILVDVPAGGARDEAGNGNAPAKQFSITYDITAPTPTITATQQSPTNAATINFQVKFEENVTGLEQGDIKLSGTAAHGGAANFSALNSTTYAFDVSPESDGTILVDIPAGAAQDAAGNNNTRAKQFSMIHDTTAPAPTITATQQSPTNAATINFQVKFEENVTGFDAGDIELSGTASGRSVGSFSGGGASYAFDVSPSPGASPALDGTILVNIPAGAARDAPGNPVDVATRFLMTYDGTPPAPAIAPMQPGPTNLAAVPFNLTFGEPVNATALEASHMETSSGTVQNLGTVWPHGADFGSPGSGGGQFDGPRGVAVDAEGRIYVADAGNHRVSIFSRAGHHAGDIGGLASPLDVAVGGPYGRVYVADAGGNSVRVFDSAWEHVHDIENFSAPSSVAVDSSGNAYVADRGNGRVQVFDHAWRHVRDVGGPHDQPSGVAVDGSGSVYVADSNNGSVRVYDAAGQPVRDIYDSLGSPSAVDVDPAGNVFVADAGNGRVRAFDSAGQPVASLANSPNNVTGVAVDSSGRVYAADGDNHRVTLFDAARAEFDVADPADGQALTVSLPPGLVQDAAGNPNGASNTASISIDRTAPAPNVTSALPGPTGAATIPFTVEFTEPVTGFEAGDIELSNDTEHGGVGNFSGSGASYSFDVSPTTDGTILVDVPADGAQDKAGNGNTAADQFSITYDSSVPTPTVTAAQQSPTNAATINFQVKFKDDVTGFEQGDIELSNDTAHGGVGNFSGSGSLYTFDVSPTADGTILVDVPAGAARSAATNTSSTKSAQFSITYDGTAPAPNITATQQSPTNAATINFQVKFEENVTGFEAVDIELSNDTAHGGVGNFSGSGASYSFDVSPTADGAILVDVPAGAARDAAGNNNTQAKQFSMIYGGTAPAPNITAAQRSPTGAAMINFQVNFTEPVTGFEAGDIELSGSASSGGVGNFSGSGSLYAFDVSPATDGTILVDVPANAAQDATGNGNTAADQFSITYDSSVPTPTITAAQQSPTNATTINFRVNFTEPVTGFEAGDIELSNDTAHGGAANFAGSGDSYSFDVSPTIGGTILVDVPAGAARSAATGIGSGAARFSITYEGAAPAAGVLLEAARLDLEAGSNGRLTVTFGGAVTMPDARSFAGEIVIRGGGGEVALSAADVPSVASGHPGDAAFALDISGAKRVQLNGADLGSATVSLPDGFVSDAGGSPYARGGLPPVPLAHAQDPSPPRLAAAAINLEPGSSSTGRLTVTFDEAVTMPDARSFAGEIEIRGRSGGGDATLALSAGDFESAASGSEGGRTFALPVPGPKAEALGAAEYSDPLSTTVSLPDGFVTNGRSAHEREPAPLSAGRDSDGPSFVWAFVLNGSSVAAVYDEPVLAVPAHYSNVRVDGAPAEGNRGAASGAAAFGNNVVVSWNAGIGTTASAGSEVRFDVSGNVTDAFGNPIENPGPKSAGGQEGNKRSVLVGAFSRGPGDPSAGAARLGAAAFNALSEERGYAFLVNVTEYALPAGASGAAAGAALRDAHDGGRGPALYVGPASDAALRGMAGYAGANGITLVSHSSAARSLAVEGDGIYRLEPGAAHLARVLAVEIARGGFGAVVPVVQTDARGPEYGLLGPLASDLGPLGVRVGPPVEFSGGGGGAAAAPIGDAVREAAGSGTARSVAVVYAGSDSGLAAIAGGAGAGSPVRDRSVWFAAGGAGAGAGGGVAASPLVLRDAAAVQLARDVRLSAVQFAVERNAATDFVDYAAYGPAGAPGPAASATPAYAAYEAARILGRALALAGGDPSGAGGHVARAADSDGGPLGRTGVNGAGDLRLPITYGAWSVSGTAAEWERAPELLRGLDSCGIDLEKSALALPNLSAGSTSRPARQTVTNIGTGPMPAVSVSATDWAQFKDGVPVQGLLPFSYTEMAVGLDGASPRRADSTPLAAGTVIPGGTPPGGSVDVDFRINLAGLDALEADFISQTVTFVVNCS